MKHQLLAFIAAGCGLLVAPLALLDEASQDVRSFTDLRVGRTNILCYQEPCPLERHLTRRPSCRSTRPSLER